MIELLMRKSLGRLVTIDAFGIDQLRPVAEGATVTARITQPRSLRHHRLWFALLQTVFEAQNLYPTLDQLHDAIKIGIGHCEQRKTLAGELYWHPKSVSFSSLDQTEFRQFFDRAVELIIERIFPHTNRADLEQRCYEILGEPTPADLNR